MKLTGNRCRCGECGEYFNSLTGFDGHRVGRYGAASNPGDRRCFTPAELQAKGWSKNAAGFWITEARKTFDPGRDGTARSGDLSSDIAEAA